VKAAPRQHRGGLVSTLAPVLDLGIWAVRAKAGQADCKSALLRDTGWSDSTTAHRPLVRDPVGLQISTEPRSTRGRPAQKKAPPTFPRTSEARCLAASHSCENSRREIQECHDGNRLSTATPPARAARASFAPESAPRPVRRGCGLAPRFGSRPALRRPREHRRCNHRESGDTCGRCSWRFFYARGG
jgi:hypothetical protein